MKQYSIVGQKHLNLNPYLAGINAGVGAVLVREPTNQYDPNAIQVWIDNKKVGYIPKNQNATLAMFIDQQGQEASKLMAMDSAQRAIPAKFVRSPNSGYPMVQV